MLVTHVAHRDARFVVCHREPATSTIVPASAREPELVGRMSFDRDDAIVMHGVMAIAQQEQVRRIMGPAVLAMHDVMHLEKTRRPAARHTTAITIAVEDKPSYAR